MISFGPGWKTEIKTAVYLTFDKILTEEESKQMVDLFTNIRNAMGMNYMVDVGTRRFTVTYTPERPESETTPQEGYVPPVPLPPGR